MAKKRADASPRGEMLTAPTQRPESKAGALSPEEGTLLPGAHPLLDKSGLWGTSADQRQSMQPLLGRQDTPVISPLPFPHTTAPPQLCRLRHTMPSFSHFLLAVFPLLP